MTVKIDAPRLFLPLCGELTPVETLHKNPWFIVRNRGGYFTTEYRQPQVVILPVVDKQAIVMVRVKRPVINDITLELPAGGAKENESPLEAAARELGEETGVGILDLGRFKELPPIAGSPNRNPNLMHIFQIQLMKREFENRRDHDDEIADVKLFDFDEIKELLIRGEIYVAIPVAVISKYLIECE